MQEEEPITLKYGDKIILKCTLENKCYYLLARGEQYWMESQLQSQVSRSYNMYYFQQHMIFTIFPKLLYEAQKKYNNDKSSGSNSEIQRQLLQTRMETEKKYNQNLIQSTHGKQVLYGDTIMLYQEVSQVFLVKIENNVINSNLGSILSPQMYFMIQPDPLALDLKLGTPVRSFDQFLLLQQDSILKLDALESIQGFPDVMNVKNFDHHKLYLTIPMILENQQIFKFYKAQYKYCLSDSKEKLSHNALQAIIMPVQNEPTYLYYGQFVRIAHYKILKKNLQSQKTLKSIKEDKEEHLVNKGYLTSSINAVGCYPMVYLQVNDVLKNDVLEQASSIFQIIPDSDQKFGQLVTFQVANKPNLLGFTNFLLKHLLTGEFLKISSQSLQMELSDQLSLKYQSISNSLKSAEQVPNRLSESIGKVSQKNQPAIKLYQNLMNTSQTQQDERLATVVQPQQQFDEVFPQSIFHNESLLFITKLGNNPTFNREQLPFTVDTQFTMATPDGKQAIEVDSQEAYVEKLITRQSNFNYYSEETNPEKGLKKQLHQEWLLFIPELDIYYKKPKSTLSDQEKEILEFIDNQEKIQAQNKVGLGHFKQSNDTYLSTFINLNPLKTRYYDVISGEEYKGSNFMFEKVSEEEIQTISELLDWIYPIVNFAKHPVQLTSIKLRLSKLRLNQKDLTYSFHSLQQQTMKNVVACTRSIIKMMLWIQDTHETLAMENIISDPIVARQTLLRELGIIDFVIKLLYELHINGLLYEQQDNIIADEELYDQEMNSLIGAISSFLQLVCKNSYENSLYTVQWYFLYKHILLKGQLNELMRLDILITQIFQQTDMNITFQFEVKELSKETKFSNYNQHAYNLLIAFCLYTKYRNKEGVEEIIKLIFQTNRDTIFTQLEYDEQMQISLRNRLHQMQCQKSLDSKGDVSPSLIQKNTFINKASKHDYLISCVRLASEIAKSSPSLTLKYIKTIFPFTLCASVIQDTTIQASTRYNFLDLWINSYISKHLLPLLDVEFPQNMKLIIRSQEGGFLGLFKRDTSQVQIYILQQKKLADLLKKVQNKYLTENANTLDFWFFLSQFLSTFWRGKTIYEIKSADHLYIKYLLLTFTTLFKKGLFIDYLNEAHNFYCMYHRFIEFLKQSLVSATLEDLYLKHQVHGKKREQESKPQEVGEYLFDNQVSQKKQNRSQSGKSLIWLDELIDILILLEKFQQNTIVDQFIAKDDNYCIFDDLAYLQKFATKLKYQNVVSKLKSAKRSSYNIRAKIERLDSKDKFTTQELTKILRECSFSRKTLILEYMNGLKQNDVSLIYFLVELLTFNQIRLSASVTELIWTLYQTKSIFLSTLNQTLLINSEDEQLNQPSLSSGNISTEFSNIYWKLHFAMISLNKSLQQDAQKNYEQINDALSDILIIAYPDYAAKSDMQMFLEINQLENEERHNQAQEQKLVKSKVRQELAQEMSKIDLEPDQSMYSPERVKRSDSQKSATNADYQNKMVWRINNQLTIDVASIFQRQKLLRYLKFHVLLQRLIEDLIEETRGTLFREKDVQLSQQKSKGWEIKSDILEKAILFLIYFVIRNEENQECILNTSLKIDSFLIEMTNVKRKQLQTMIFILFAELFRDNYNILFYLDKYAGQDSILDKMFNKFGSNLQSKNYESCIYFIQFLAILLKVKESDVVQNHELIIQLFLNTKSLSQFHLETKALIQSLDLKRVEQYRQGMMAHPDTPMNRKKVQDGSFIDVPPEIVYLQELIKLMTKICSKRSPTIDDFIKKMLPLSLLSEMIMRLDDWFTLKYEVVQCFKMVYLVNTHLLSFEEKQEVIKIVHESILKQIQISFLENQQIKRLYTYKFLNVQLINIYGIHTYYSNSEFILSVDFIKALNAYVIHGLLEVVKQYVTLVMPKYFIHITQINPDLDYFDEKAKNDLLFTAQGICETLKRVKESFQDQASHQYLTSTIPRGRNNKKKNRTLLLTQKLLQNNQEEEQNDIQDQMVAEETDEDKQYVLKIYDTCKFIQMSEIGYVIMKNDIQQIENVILQKWETSISAQKKKLIDEHLIASEREQEIQQLINLVITLKRDNTRKFKSMVTALIQILSEDSVSSSVKLKSINILRKLSNYKEDLQISKSILKDLSELGFTDFLCDLIKSESNSEQKLEYVKAFVDYLDDSSVEIQTSFLQYLQRDQNNSFIFSLQQSIKDLYQDIRMAEISNLERKNHSIAQIINNKINACIYIFELFRLACEDHFEAMQHFLREQPNAKQQLNFIIFTADLFEKYMEIMNENNAPLGQKLLDFLIESVQGPCLQNQNELCHQTKILEVLEHIILEQRIDEKQFQKRDIVYSNLRAKVFLLQLSLMEGNRDQEIAKKISQYFNPQVLFERIELVYWKIIKKIKNTQIEINLEVKILSRIQTEGDDSLNNNHGVIQTKDTKETLPNQNIFLEYFSDQISNSKSPVMKQSTHHAPVHINVISEEDMENMVNESFTMYLLLKKLTNQIPEIKSFQEDGSNKLKKALNYYKNQTASIEIVNMNGNLEKIYFQLPTLMHYLTEETKQQFLESVCRDSINDKINGLLDNIDNFYMEMVHFMKLRKIGLKYNNRFIVYLRNLCIIVAFFINLLITINNEDSNLQIAVTTLAIVNIVLYAIILSVWITIRMSLEYEKIFKSVSDFIKLNYFKKSLNNKNDTMLVYPFQITVLKNLLIIKQMIFNSYSFYWLVYLLFCILGLTFNKSFYGLLLLDIIDHSPILRNVIRSISQNYKQLLMTALLGVLIMYLYSLIAYQSSEFRDQLKFANDIDESNDPEDSTVCYSSFQCLVFMIHQGLRAGGGIGDVLYSPLMHSNQEFYAQRFFYDVSFFIIINIIWLNIIFGIIIDTFAELRDNKNQRDFDSSNRCYICNLSRTLFEKEGVSFDNHIHKYHNPWSYLAYIIYLKVKVKTEHTGIESYVYSKILKRDISWFPIQKALDLELLGVQFKGDEEE